MLQTSIAEKTAPPAPSMLKKSNSVKHHSTQNHHKSGSSADPSSGNCSEILIVQNQSISIGYCTFEKNWWLF